MNKFSIFAVRSLYGDSFVVLNHSDTSGFLADQLGYGTDIKNMQFLHPYPSLAGFWAWEGEASLLEADKHVCTFVSNGQWRRATVSEINKFIADTSAR